MAAPAPESSGESSLGGGLEGFSDFDIEDLHIAVVNRNNALVRSYVVLPFQPHAIIIVVVLLPHHRHLPSSSSPPLEGEGGRRENDDDDDDDDDTRKRRFSNTTSSRLQCFACVPIPPPMARKDFSEEEAMEDALAQASAAAKDTTQHVL